MPTYKFTSTAHIQAPDMDAAKQRFADDSFDFAANAECEEVESDHDRIGREVDETISRMRAVWPSCADYFITENGTVELFDAAENIFEVIPLRRFEMMFA